MYLHDDLHPMVMVQGVSHGQIAAVIDELFPADSAARPCIGLQNSADGFVVSGKPESVARVCGVLSDTVKDDNGQTPENLLWRLDVEQARGIAHNVLINPVDWVTECRSMAALGVRRFWKSAPPAAWPC